MKKLLISQATYDKLKSELNKLNDEKPLVQEAIAEARSHGDLSENAEYHAAREKFGFIEAQIAQIGAKLANSKVVKKEDITTDKVGYGVSLKLYNKGSKKTDEFTVVGEGEADLDREDEISMNSPMGLALLNKVEGDDVEIKLPFGIVKYKIKKIFVK
jgi:transcription elongation factor GreA